MTLEQKVTTTVQLVLVNNFKRMNGIFYQMNCSNSMKLKKGKNDIYSRANILCIIAYPMTSGWEHFSLPFELSKKKLLTENNN